MLQNIIKEQEDSYHLKKLNTSLDGHKGSLLEVNQAETVPRASNPLAGFC